MVVILCNSEGDDRRFVEMVVAEGMRAGSPVSRSQFGYLVGQRTIDQVGVGSGKSNAGRTSSAYPTFSTSHNPEHMSLHILTHVHYQR